MALARSLMAWLLRSGEGALLRVDRRIPPELDPRDGEWAVACEDQDDSRLRPKERAAAV